MKVRREGHEVWSSVMISRHENKHLHFGIWLQQFSPLERASERCRNMGQGDSARRLLTAEATDDGICVRGCLQINDLRWRFVTQDLPGTDADEKQNGDKISSKSRSPGVWNVSPPPSFDEPSDGPSLTCEKKLFAASTHFHGGGGQKYSLVNTARLRRAR